MELNNIFNLANFQDLNFSIIQLQLVNVVKQNKIVAIYLFLVIEFLS